MVVVHLAVVIVENNGNRGSSEIKMVVVREWP